MKFSRSSVCVAASLPFLLWAACTPKSSEEPGASNASSGGSGGTSSAPAGSGGSSSAGAAGSGGTTSTPAATGGTPGTTATGGDSGTTATGGTSGSGEGSPDAAGPATGSGGAAGDAGPGAPVGGDDNATYNCTLIFGINATEEWYSQGFEKLVDGNKWELIKVHSGFIELWADPNNGFWKTGITSPCTMNPNAPDRIIFEALNFDYTTLDQWLPPLTATVKNLRAKYPSVKRIELGTFVRAPQNKACPQREPKRSTIAAAEDQAIEMVAAANPDLVRVQEKFECKACSEFSGNPPHPTAAGGATWAKMIAEHYGLGK